MFKSLFSSTIFFMQYRRIFVRNNPLLVVLIFLTAGICYGILSARSIPEYGGILLLCTLVLNAVLLRMMWSRPTTPQSLDGHSLFWSRIFPASCCALFFAVGAYSAGLNEKYGEDFTPSVGKQVVHADVSSLLSTGIGRKVLLLSDGANAYTGAPFPGYGRLSLRDNELTLRPGDRISFVTAVRRPMNRGNPGEYDWEADCKSNGVLWLVSVQGKDAVALLTRGSPYSPAALLFRLREAMNTFLTNESGRGLTWLLGSWYTERFAAPNRAFMKAVIIGDLGEMDYPQRKAFSDSGLAHIWSASGSHVAIVGALAVSVAAAMIWVFSWPLYWTPFRKFAALLSAPAIVLYCLLVGGKPPAIRSMIMGLVVAAAILSDRPWNSINSLAAAALLILLLSPLALLTPSFQLSFAAVAGILLVQPWKELGEGDEDDPNPSKGRAVLRWMKVAALTSLAATIAVNPLIVQAFHSFPVYTLPANMFGELFMSLGLSISLCAVVVGLVWPSLGAVVLMPGELFCGLTVETARFFAGLPWSVLYFHHMSPMRFLVCVAGSGALIYCLRRRSLRGFIACAAVLGALAGGAALIGRVYGAPTTLKAVFLNVGKGDAALVTTPEAKTYLIDGGLTNPYFDSGTGIVLPSLAYFGMNSLDGVIMTHAEQDHMGGLMAVVKSLPVKRFIWNSVTPNQPYLKELLGEAAKARLALTHVDRTCRVDWTCESTIRFLNATPRLDRKPSHKDLNNECVLCRFQYGKASMLFAGDLEWEGERELLEAGVDVSATVLKVGHHGGKTTSSDEFLEAVRPKIVVLSAEYPSSGGLPNAATLERLRRSGADIFWTGRDGAVTIETDGSTVFVSTGKSGPDGVRLFRKPYPLGERRS